MSMKEGAIKNVLSGPFELYEMSTEVNKEQKQGRMKIRIGASWEKESYATLNIMTSTIDSIAGEMSTDQAFEAMEKIEESGDYPQPQIRIHLGGAYWGTLT